jgi:hypothetical protein
MIEKLRPALVKLEELLAQPKYNSGFRYWYRKK